MTFYKEQDGDIILNIRVIPRAAKDSIQGLRGDMLKVRIQAPPVEGKANTHLIRFLSEQWKIPRSGIAILSGGTGRNKRLKISAPSNEFRAMLSSITSKPDQER